MASIVGSTLQAQSTQSTNDTRSAAASASKPDGAVVVDVATPSSDGATLRRQVNALHVRSANGDNQAEAVLASWKRQGIGERTLYMNVVKIDKLALERLDPQLISELGMAHIIGEGGLQRDVDHGLTLIEEASSSGDSSATLSLEEVYELGTKNPDWGIDLRRVRKHLETIAKKGDPLGFFGLGNIYNVYDKDPLKAVDAFEQAGNGGVAKAYRRAGVLLRQGNMTKAQKRRGLDLIEQAAAMGNYAAAAHAGLIYFDGTSDTPRDVPKAIKYMTSVLESSDTVHKQNLLDALGLPDCAELSKADIDKNALRQQTLKSLATNRKNDPNAERFLTLFEAVRKTAPTSW